MNRNIKMTPEGTRDFLFEECLARRRVEKSLTELFQSRGYHEVMTTTLEYYDMFSAGSAALPQELLYKMTAGNGRLLVVRPDSTAPIARMVATRLKDEPLPIRLYYNQPVFKKTRALSGGYNEVRQAGVELLGASGLKADLEVLSAAVDSLACCAVTGYKLEISHVGYFNALLKAIPADGDTLERIRQMIETKNFAALNDLLDSLPPCGAVEAIRRLPGMFGDIGVIEQAESLFCNEEAKESLRYIHTLYGLLEELGLSGRISIDLGLVHRNEYYTGLIFQGYMEGSGLTVLSGGRYDRLLGEFGRAMPAIGFGAEVDALASVLLAQGEEIRREIPDVLLFSDDAHVVPALRHAAALAKEGLTAEQCMAVTRREAEREAALRGIPRLDIVTETVTSISVKGEKA